MLGTPLLTSHTVIRKISGKMGDIFHSVPSCLDHNEDDYGYFETPFNYDFYTGRVYNNNEGTCGRCDHDQCLEHQKPNNFYQQYCPYEGDSHEPWCLSNHDVHDLIRSYSPNITNLLEAKEDDASHIKEHIGNTVAQANKKLYDQMLAEQPDDIEDIDAVSKFKAKNKFAKEIIPQAITDGYRRFRQCKGQQGGFEHVKWDE